jgi:hypothetical protein
MASDIEWAPVGPAQLEGDVYRGEDEVSKAFAGKGSEVPLGQEFACRFVLRDAKIVRADAFLSWAEALEAAGLRE